MWRNRFAFGALLLVAAVAARGAQGQSLAPAAAKVVPAVVLVTSPTIGTAFAIRTQAGSTIFLTAAHVIGCKSGGGGCGATADLVLDGITTIVHHARVIAHGDVDHDDLALLALPEGPLPVTILATKPAQRGDALAVLGYPEDIVQAQGGSAVATADVALTLGSILALDANGIFEFTGASYHGDSGGPIFDPASGAVFGVVHGQSRANLHYQGFGLEAIAAFLRTSDDTLRVAATPPTTPVAAAATAPDRYSAPKTSADCEFRFPDAERASCFQPFADRGDPHAAYSAATAYFFSAMTVASNNPAAAASDPNTSLAVHYLQRAADAHDIDAEMLLGQKMRLGIAPFSRDDAQGRYWQQRAWDDAVRAAAAGDVHAAYLKALQRTTTDNQNLAGVSYDPATAKQELRACAERGGAECARALGDMLRYDSPPDPAGTAKWWGVAAAAGNKPAMLELAWAYVHGFGVPVDLQAAVKWYRGALPMLDAQVALNGLSMGIKP